MSIKSFDKFEEQQQDKFKFEIAGRIFTIDGSFNNVLKLRGIREKAKDIPDIVDETLKIALGEEQHTQLRSLGLSYVALAEISTHCAFTMQGIDPEEAKKSAARFQEKSD